MTVLAIKTGEPDVHFASRILVAAEDGGMDLPEIVCRAWKNPETVGLEEIQAIAAWFLMRLRDDAAKEMN